MLNVAISRKMVERAKEIINYNINIMDSKGIIIASTDPSRVGSFHEIAYKILTDKDDIIEIGEASDLLGVKNGINMALLNRNEKMGVLGITGKPDEVRPYAHLLKFAMETMFEYEVMKQKDVNQLSPNDKLVSSIVSGQIDEDDLVQFAADLNFDINTYRIPILITFSGKVSKDVCFDLLNQNRLHSSQDIKSLTNNNMLLIFKYFDKIPDEQLSAEYRNYIMQYLDELLCVFNKGGISYNISIGSFCRKMKDYNRSVNRAFWVNKKYKSKMNILFFYDHVGDYLKELIPLTELQEIFSFFIKGVNKETLNNMSATCASLSMNNYNLAKTSEALYIHKNTLFLKISKIKSLFGIDLMHNTNDRTFFEYLSYYYDCISELELP